MAHDAIEDLLAEIRRLDERVYHYDKLLRRLASIRDTPANRLTQLPGVGETTATAIVTTVGNGHEFRNGRQFAAWLGLVPSQYSSGGKARLGRISEAGNSYVRTLLVLGVAAEVILDHVAEVKVDHLREDGGLWTADADSGARCGDKGVEPSRQINQGNRARVGDFAGDGAAVFI